MLCARYSDEEFLQIRCKGNQSSLDFPISLKTSMVIGTWGEKYDK